ncbi:MAG TPA: hypothetical protein VLA88_02450 [Candidatus Saccharimonadales bacterium]|nr:hypothetical protein [Candidatus Saccharimonadales bacterium]
MTKLDINSKDVLLLLIHAKVGNEDVGSIAGRTRVVKLVFLFKNEVLKQFKSDSPQLEKLKFDPWNFGPFSKQIYDDIEFLSNIGFIHVKASQEDASIEEAAEYTYWEDGLKDADEVEEFTQEEFTLTDQGTKYVDSSLVPLLSDNQKEVLVEFKRAFGQVPLYALLEYVYKKYPEYTTESKIKTRVLGRV